ncbi:MAG TPA: glycosyltransferase family 2 protein [Chloroflexota bacterium]|nr:glycosyltransferase family 2 protein [Chloroflexota bacterium]
MDATIAVVSFNVAPLLERCLESARAALHESGGGQLLVVDNASLDDSVSLVRERFPEATLIVNDANAGFGAACNQALGAAQTEALLFLNPDAELSTGALAALLDRLTREPSAALVGPRVTYPDGRPQPTRRRFPTPTVLFLESTPLEWRGPSWPALAAYYRDGAPEVASKESWVSGACLLGRIPALREVAGFDPAFFMYFEEVDLCRRLASRGWGTWYEPAAHALHHHSQSADQDVREKDRRYFRSKYRYAERYFGRSTGRLLRLSAGVQFAAEAALQRRRGDDLLAQRYRALARWHFRAEP